MDVFHQPLLTTDRVTEFCLGGFVYITEITERLSHHKKARKTKLDWGLINVEGSHIKLKCITTKIYSYSSEKLTDHLGEGGKRTLAIFP